MHEYNDAVQALTESQRHELLANRIRRHVLAKLAEESAPIPLAELAESVVARAEDGRIRDVRGMQIQLHHVHLPHLGAHGLLEYDPSETEVVSNRVTSAVVDFEGSS